MKNLKEKIIDNIKINNYRYSFERAYVFFKSDDDLRSISIFALALVKYISIIAVIIAFFYAVGLLLQILPDNIKTIIGLIATILITWLITMNIYKNKGVK